MTKLLKLFSLICFIAVVTPSFAQLSVGISESPVGSAQFELISKSDLYLILPETQSYRKQEYDSIIGAVWKYGKVFSITNKEKEILETKKNICVAKIIAEAWEVSINPSGDINRTPKILMRNLSFDFRFSKNFAIQEADFTFASMPLTLMYSKEYFSCKETSTFKKYIDEKAKLKNFTPNFIGLTIKMIDYNLRSKKVLNRQTQNNTINIQEVSQLKNNILYTTDEPLVKLNSKNNTQRSEIKTFKKYRYKYILTDYDSIEKLLATKEIKYLIYPVTRNAWGEICLTVVNVETGEIIYSKKAKSRDFGDRIGKRELKKLSKAIAKS